MHRSRLTRCDEMYLEESQLYAAGRHSRSLPTEITRDFADRLHQLGLHRWDEELGASAARHAQCMRTSVARLFAALGLLVIGAPLLAYKSSAWIVPYLALESGPCELMAAGVCVAIAAVVIIRVISALHDSSERVIQSLMVIAYRMRELDQRLDASERSR